MTNTLRFLQIFALGTWLGAIIYLSFVVAPGAFTILNSRDQAGALVGFALSRLHVLGLILGIVYLAVAAMGRGFSSLARPAALAVLLMILLTAGSQWRVSARMGQLRREMVSVDATPPDNPLRLEFDSLHRISVRLEGAVLLVGLFALYFTTKQSGS